MNLFLKYIKPYVYYYILGPIFMLVEVAGEIILPWLLSKIINVGAANHDVGYITRIGLVMVLVAVCMAVGGVLGAWFAANAAMNFGADLRMDLFEKIQKFSFNNIDKFSTGSLITRLTNDITQIQNMIMQTLRACLRSPGILIGAITMAFVISQSLAIVFIIVVPVLVISIIIIMKKAFPRFKALQNSIDSLNSCVQEGLVNIRLIKSFVRKDYEEKRFDEHNKDLFDKNIHAMNIMIKYQPVMTLALNATTVAVVWFGGNMIIGGKMQVGDLTAFINYIVQIMGSLTMLSIVFLNWARAVASFRRVREVLEEEIDLTDDNALYKERKVEDGNISFKNVSFRYYKNSEENVLSNISFDVKAGQTLGIIGPTGSGKTTLVSLISRLYDVDAGEVCVDGVNVKEYSLDNLRNGIGMVLQKNTLFSGDIYENLRWGNENADEKTIAQAAADAQADKFIRGFREGYNTQLGQGGSNVSGGQKQRIAIARALLKDARLILFDEPTASVDIENEEKIKQAIEEIKENHTIITIAHRLNTIENADCIYLVDNGVIAESGTHDELIAGNGIYKRLYDTKDEVSYE